ncbi:MAG: hypothetical protein HYZ63_01445 [Candidatus Andersenbacteria bacterium]|nr:hypothetical protein [Candidatus Andersenbacteria bacterium]
MDFTSLWVTWQRYKTNVLVITAIVAAFGVGWQVGRMMSPYYASSPIILTDVTSQEMVKSLETLKQTGIAARPTAAKEPVVAAATTTNPGASQGEFVASKNSNLYHHKSCATVNRISQANKRFFATALEAEAAGLTPSKCTLDKLK